MSDALKDAAFALLGVFLVNGLLQRHAERALLNDVRRHVTSGELHVRVRPGGTIGLLGGVAASATIEGEGTTFEHMPYALQDGGGIRSEIQRLHIRLKDATFRRVRIDRFEATLPMVRFDGGAVLVDSRIILRTAGEGTAEAVIGTENLVRFLQQRVAGLEVSRAELRNGLATIEGVFRFLGSAKRFFARGGIRVEEGRSLELADLVFRLDEAEPPAPMRELALRQLSPLMDIERDLGLGDAIVLTSAEIGEGIVRVRGRFRLPERPREASHAR